MASINKLSIRGVRAFNPEDDEQVVEFYFPVTIIVGANGCGKTTIIESLKYAITGSFPPGSQSGRAFVHDCKSIGQSKVKANVKLRFMSRAGQSMVVVRSMEVTQKKTKATFKQLDGVLRMMDPETGERVSLSHKCSELDKQLPGLLGVSKPILEHVVFCHQEDASWPLQEGAVLKKRFDDIFDSTKYSKALKVFRETEKEFLGKCKDYKTDLAEYKSHKYAADGFRKELDEQNEAIESMDEMKKEIDQKIAKLDQKIASLTGVMDKVEDFKLDIDSRKNELAQEQVVVQKQRSMLEEDLTRKHSMQELKDMTRDFRDKMDAQVDRKEELQAEVDRLNADIEKARQDEMALTSKLGKLTAQKEAHEKNLRDRYNKMESIAQRYSINLTQMSQSSQAGDTSFAASLSQGTLTVGGDDETHADESTMLSITAEDMQGFFRAVEEKEAELKANLKEHRDRFQAEEDKITSFLTEVGGKLQAVENDRMRLAEEKRDADREHKELTNDANKPRVRRNDVEDLRRRVKKFAEDRDEIAKDKRHKEIPIEIRQIEEKMDTVRRKIDDESIILDGLRHTADAQTTLTSLQEQCRNDMETLQEAIHEEAYSFQKFSIAIDANLPKDDDAGDQIVHAVEKMSEAAREKQDALNSTLNRATDDQTNTQKILSEKSAVLSNNQKSLASLKSKLQSLAGSASDVKKVVDDLRRHEANLGETLTADEDSPRDLLKYLDGRLEALEEDALELNAPDVARKVLKKLKKMAVVREPGRENDGTVIACPCCKRTMDSDEASVFNEVMTELQRDIARRDPEAQEQYRTSKATYQKMRKIVENKMDSLRDFRRMTGEAADLEKETKRLQEDVLQYSTTLKDKTEEKDDAQSEVNELRGLVDTIRRWSDDANRIAGKKMEIKQKRSDLEASVTDSSRDLRTVERSLADLKEEKEALSNKMFRLNKEMTSLNNEVTNKSTQLAQQEKLLKDKEERYSVELKASERKKELSARIREIGEEDKKLAEKVAPLQQKKKKREVEKQRLRSHGNEEEQRLLKVLSSYDSDIQNLRNLEKQIGQYLESSGPVELEQISSKVSKVLERIESKRAEIRKLEPDLESVTRAVDDQERHKKQLKQNIDILVAEQRMEVLEKEIKELEDERRNVEGYERAAEDWQAARDAKEELMQKKARTDGRFTSHLEQIKAMKRKLSQKEYKDVDEEFRVASIKLQTTKIAAEDLRKYGNALDKALLQFHGVKIGEINKIIRELWIMTYKGEDITNIEIVSGQEPGSKAAKSYNYRVVMTKGGSKLDMRGRCSAGQRVLASIVIRLALAETFGVNCGALALDEPTVNLDYNNKKGLAIALAHIVASRAHQVNFQLIMITHDEEFVTMMKTELSSMTGFSMPEKYFQVCREENTDGKFYSKINAVDWDELV